MRWNGKAATLVDEIANLVRRTPFQIRERSPDAEEMTFSSRHFHSRDNEEIIHWQPVFPHESFFEQIGDAIICVVVGQGKTMKSLRFGGRDILLRAGNAVARKERMRVEVDLERHSRERSLAAAKCKASVSRNGRWFARRWVM